MINVANFQGKLDTDVVAQIFLASANLTPIYSMAIGNGQVRPTKSEKAEWFGSGTDFSYTQINSGAHNAATTTLTVDSSAPFSVGDMLVSPATSEIMQVSAVPSITTITVVRGIGSTSGADASVANDAYLYKIGRAAGEGSGSPASSAAGKVPFFNLAQTMREAVEMTGRMLRTETLTEDERGFQRRAKFEKFSADIEMALLHGVRSDHTNAQSERVTTMAGLREAIVTNVTNIGGTMSVSESDAFAEKIFATGSGERTLYAGSKVIQAYNDLYKDKVRLVPADGTVGLKVMKVLTPFGVLNLVHHRGFVGAMSGDAVAVDPAQIVIRHTKGGLPVLKEDTQDKGVDGIRDEWFAELTLEYGHEQTHGQLRGVTGADLGT